MNCPICRQALEGGELVMVCTGCHQALGGGLSVNATGEFRVPADLVDSDSEVTDVGAPVAMQLHSHATQTCAWCNKHEREVKKLLGRGNLALCDECVALCCDILDAELGTSWR